jgi:hypothetical protein
VLDGCPALTILSEAWIMKRFEAAGSRRFVQVQRNEHMGKEGGVMERHRRANGMLSILAAAAVLISGMLLF